MTLNPACSETIFEMKKVIFRRSLICRAHSGHIRPLSHPMMPFASNFGKKHTVDDLQHSLTPTTIHVKFRYETYRGWSPAWFDVYDKSVGSGNRDQGWSAYVWRNVKKATRSFSGLWRFQYQYDGYIKLPWISTSKMRGLTCNITCLCKLLTKRVVSMAKP